MAMLGAAALAMWWDMAPDMRAEFEHWHTHEHFPERLALPGFMRASRWADAKGGDGFFVLSNNGQQTFSRAGSFSLDNSGHLVAPDGSKVQSTAGGDLNLSALNSGTYVSWSIAPSGAVNAVDSTGATTTLDTIATATFANPGGLSRIGNSQFETTTNSGPAQIGSPGSGGRGNLTAGYLEMSNVDLASELTNLIISERGFQANSRVITTSDEVLQSLISLKN